MSNQIIYEKNTKIAQFMGGRFETVYWGGEPEEQFMMPDRFHISDGDVRRFLRYNESWDWLMPVVASINELSFNDKQHFSIDIERFMEADLDKVYEKVADFCTKYIERHGM